MSARRDLGVTAAGGFAAAGVACGIKPEGLDLALVVGEAGTLAAGVFTTNQVVAAPVVWSRERLAASADARVVVLNSGNANCCTGAAGMATVQATAERAAAELGCEPAQVLVCSTGVIGVPLDAATVTAGVAKAAASLGRGADDGTAAATAILTTDTVPKQAGVVVDGVTVAGMAKGAGMLAPALAPPTPPQATMLAVLTTDAGAAPADLQAALTRACERSFNRITVDACQSTNDTVLLLASGAAGKRLPRELLAEAVEAVCQDLATQLLLDAEGATKLVTVEVGGAGTEAAALQVARRIAESPLVKTAVHGGDPNWGRILQAAGTAGVPFDLTRTRVEVGGVAVCDRGEPTGADAAAALQARAVTFRVHLGGEGPWAAVRTVDLSAEYVRINAEYTT